MAAGLDLPSVDDVVRRLRAAGCVFAEDEARLLIAEARAPAQLAEMVDLRVGGRPLELVLGWAEFAGLRIVVEPGVFVPRRRTELLVQEAAALVRATGGDPTRGVVAVDLCCGSGAVGVALATELSGARDGNPARVELHAADVDPAAVRCARRNVAAVDGHVYEGDLDEALPTALLGAVDVLVANAPYVPTYAIRLMPPEARDHEPRVALDGGTDGLDVQRRVISAAPRWLAPGGHLLIETSRRQAPRTAAAVRAAGLVPRVVTSDELDATVVVGARRDQAGDQQK